MRIAGFQSLSLQDFPGRACSIVFTQGCVFRCGYCHNPELIPQTDGTMSAGDVLEHLEKHRNVVNAVCITGGEPTIQPDLPDFLLVLRLKGFAIKLDTNGLHPRMVERILKDRLVDYVAMDVKHAWEGYASLAGVPEHVVAQVRETFQLIQASGIPHEFRTTICPGIHTEDGLSALAQQFAPATTWAWQRVRYEGILDPNMPRGEPLALIDLRERILNARPDLSILIRS